MAARAVVLLQALCLCLAAAGPAEDHRTLEELYTDGVVAYGNKDWKGVVGSMSALVNGHNALTEKKERCSDRCGRKSINVPPDYLDDGELRYFHGAVERAVCEAKCLAGDGAHAGVSSKVEESLQTKEPYNYLQISLFHVRSL